MELNRNDAVYLYRYRSVPNWFRFLSHFLKPLMLNWQYVSLCTVGKMFEAISASLSFKTETRIEFSLSLLHFVLLGHRRSIPVRKISPRPSVFIRSNREGKLT